MKIIATSSAIAAASLLTATAGAAPSWHKLKDTCATSISASDGNTIWATGCSNGDGNGNWPILWTTPGEYAVSSAAEWSNTWIKLHSSDNAKDYAVGVSANYQSGQSAPNLYVWGVQGDGSVAMGLSTSATNVAWSAIEGPDFAISITADPEDPANYAAYTSWSSVSSRFAGDPLRGNLFGYIDLYRNMNHTCTGAGAFMTGSTFYGLWAVGETGGFYAMPGGCNSYWYPESDGFSAEVAVGSLTLNPNAQVYAVSSAGDVIVFDSAAPPGGWSSTHFPSGQRATQVSVGINGNLWALDDTNPRGLGGAVWTYQ